MKIAVVGAGSWGTALAGHLARAGREVSPAEIRERTEMVLDGRFARVVSTAGALA